MPVLLDHHRSQIYRGEIIMLKNFFFLANTEIRVQVGRRLLLEPTRGHHRIFFFIHSLPGNNCACDFCSVDIITGCRIYWGEIITLKNIFFLSEHRNLCVSWS